MALESTESAKARLCAAAALVCHMLKDTWQRHSCSTVMTGIKLQHGQHHNTCLQDSNWRFEALLGEGTGGRVWAVTNPYLPGVVLKALSRTWSASLRCCGASINPMWCACMPRQAALRSSLMAPTWPAWPCSAWGLPCTP